MTANDTRPGETTAADSTPTGLEPAGLWWERGRGPAPAEPPDGAVVRIVREDGAAMLAERDDWPLRSGTTDQAGALMADGLMRRWVVHHIDYRDKPPRRWDELVDIADRLIIFVAIPPTSTLTREHGGDAAASGSGSSGSDGDGEQPLPAQVQRYLDTVYGPRPHDRADWAHRTARILLAGGEPTEPMPRDQYGNTTSRVDAIRRVIASVGRRDGRDA